MISPGNLLASHYNGCNVYSTLRFAREWGRETQDLWGDVTWEKGELPCITIAVIIEDVYVLFPTRIGWVWSTRLEEPGVWANR